MIYLVGYDPMFYGSSKVSLYDIENEYSARSELARAAKLNWVHPRKKNYNHDFMLDQSFYLNVQKINSVKKYVYEQFYKDERIIFWIPSLFLNNISVDLFKNYLDFDESEIKAISIGLDEKLNAYTNCIVPVTQELKEICLQNYTANLLRSCATDILEKSDFKFKSSAINVKVDELINNGIALKEFSTFEKNVVKVQGFLEKIINEI